MSFLALTCETPRVVQRTYGESKPHSVLCHVRSRPGADRRHAFQLSLGGFFRLRFLASDRPINPGESDLGPTPFSECPFRHCTLCARREVWRRGSAVRQRRL